MTSRWFTLSIDPEVLRRMTRAQVYAARRWVRVVSKLVYSSIGGRA